MEEQVIKIQAVVRGNLERRKQYALHPQLLKRNLRKKLKEDYEIWTRLDMNFLDDDFYHTINKRATLKQNNTPKHHISTELQKQNQVEIYTSDSEKSQDSCSNRSEKEEDISKDGERDKEKEVQYIMAKGEATGKESNELGGIDEDRNGKREDSVKVEKIERIGIVEKIGDIEYDNKEQDRKEKEECNKPGIEIKEEEENRKLEEKYNKLERMLDTSCYSNPFGPEDIRDISHSQYSLDSVSSVSLEEFGQHDPFELNHSYIAKDSEFQHNFDMQGRAASPDSIQEAKVNPPQVVPDIVFIPTQNQTVPIPTENQTMPIISENQTVPIPTENQAGPELENTEEMNQSWNERSMWEGEDLFKKKSSDSNAQFVIVVHNVSDQPIYNPYVEYVHDEHNQSRDDQNVSNVSCNKKIIFSFDVSKLDSEDSQGSEESDRSMTMIYKDKECEQGKIDSHIDGLVEKPEKQEDKDMRQTHEDIGDSKDADIDKREDYIGVKSDREEQDQSSQVDGNQRSSFMNRLFGNKSSSSDVMIHKKPESEISVTDQDLVQPSLINKANLPEAQDSAIIIDKNPDFEIQPGYSEPERPLDHESDYKLHKVDGSIIPPSMQESDKPDNKELSITINKEEDIIIAPSSLEPDSLETSLLITNKESEIAQLIELPQPEAQVSASSQVQEGEHVILPVIDDFGKQNDIDPHLISDKKADEIPSEVLNRETGIEISPKFEETDGIEAEISKSTANHQEELVILPKLNESSITRNEEMAHITSKEAGISETDKKEDSDSFPVIDKAESMSVTDNLSKDCKPEAHDLSSIIKQSSDSAIQHSDQSENSSISNSSKSASQIHHSDHYIDQSASHTNKSAFHSSESSKSKQSHRSNKSKSSSSSSSPLPISSNSSIPINNIPSQFLPNHPSDPSEFPYQSPSSPHNSSLMTHSITHPPESDHNISHSIHHQDTSNSLSFSRSHKSDSHYRFDSFAQSTGKHSSKPSDQIMPNISISKGNPNHELDSDFPMYSDAGIFIEDLKAFKIETSSMNNSRASFSRPQTLRGTAENSQFVNTDSIKSQSKLEVKVESGAARYRELTPEQLAEEENLMLQEVVDQHGISSHNLIRGTPCKSSSKIKLAEIKSPESVSSNSHISATPSVIKHRVLQVTRHKAFTCTKNRPDVINKDTRIDDNSPPLMIPKDTSSNPHHIPNRSSKSSLSTHKLDMPVINELLANRFDSKAKLNEELIEALNSPILNTLKKQGSNMLSLPKLKKDFSSSVQATTYTSGRLDQLLSPGSKLFMPPARLVNTAYQKELPKPKFIESPYSLGWTDKILKTFYDVKVEILQGKGSLKPKYKLKKASAMNLPNLKLKKEPSINLEPIKKEKKTL